MTKMIPTIIGDNEIKTRQLLNDYLGDEKNWSPNKASVALVFKAMWYSSLSIERVDKIGSAICGYDVHLQEACEELVKAKVLRKRRMHGKTHYEVRY
jgi:hypothetical protein